MECVLRADVTHEFIIVRCTTAPSCCVLCAIVCLGLCVCVCLCVNACVGVYTSIYCVFLVACVCVCVCVQASGELKGDAGAAAAATLLAMLKDSAAVLAQHTASLGTTPLKKLTVSFSSCTFVVTLTTEKIYAVKKAASEVSAASAAGAGAGAAAAAVGAGDGLYAPTAGTPSHQLQQASQALHAQYDPRAPPAPSTTDVGKAPAKSGGDKRCALRAGVCGFRFVV